MAMLFEKLIPGIVAFLCGLFFIYYRNRIEERIRISHSDIWGKILKCENDIGKLSGFILKLILWFLGLSFLSVGIFLIFQYVMEN